jgi:ABC-type multidrug transport system permease subunit
MSTDYLNSELAANLVALRTIVYREVRRFTRIWPQTLLPPAITMVLYFVIFGNLIGRQIGDMGGFTYMEYIVPGLIMMSVITNSYGNVVSSFFGAKFGRHVEELLVSPLPNWLIVLGYIAGGTMARSLWLYCATVVLALAPCAGLWAGVPLPLAWAEFSLQLSPLVAALAAGGVDVLRQ